MGLLRAFGVLFLVLLALAGAALWAAIDRTPRVVRGESLSPQSVAQAKALLAANDPRRLHSGAQREAVIPVALVDDAANHLAGRFARGRATFTLADGAGQLRISIPLPGPLPGLYANLSARFAVHDGVPTVDAARIGSLPIPAALPGQLLVRVLARAGLEAELLLLQHALQRADFDPATGTIRLGFVWEAELLDRARSGAFSPADVARLKEAQGALAALLDRHAPGQPLALVQVLGPLFGDPERRSLDQRRAMLVILAAYLGEKGLTPILPEARDWPRPRSLPLIIANRHDSAQHFIISAAIAAWAGSPVANAVGLNKEIDDSRGGSGFSFADLAADRAGTRFGEMLSRHGERLDQALKDGLGDRALMPRLDDLPEGLPEAEFRRRFGSVDSPAYRKLADAIEARLDALPLYRP